MNIVIYMSEFRTSCTRSAFCPAAGQTHFTCHFQWPPAGQIAPDAQLVRRWSAIKRADGWCVRRGLRCRQQQGQCV